MNFHKLVTCYPQLPDCTKRAQCWTGAGWEGFPSAPPRLEPATHPRRGSGRRAASPRGGRVPWPCTRPREAALVRGVEKRRFLKACPQLTPPWPASAGLGQPHSCTCGGQRPPRPARTPGSWLGRSRPPGIALLRRGRRTAELLSGDESAAAKRAAPASASRAPERRAENKPRARLGERQPAATAGGGRAGWAEPAGQLSRRRETGARQHGAVSACGAPRLARGAAARPHRGANLPGRGPGLRRRGAGGGRSRRHRHNGWPGPTRARP